VNENLVDTLADFLPGSLSLGVWRVARGVESEGFADKVESHVAVLICIFWVLWQE
jgi:hypothetical protein|tara:strand:+ start:340 stop:504 length:165 start_codon:yes stop_codon:yes gene_type:complete